MAFFGRYESAPTLLNVGNTYQVMPQKSPSSVDTNSDEDEEYETDGSRSFDSNTQAPPTDARSIETDTTSGHSSTISELNSPSMELENKPRKKHKAPQPPHKKSKSLFKRSDPTEPTLSGLETKSNLSPAKSTDSEIFVPESARGSNFAGELAGAEDRSQSSSLAKTTRSPRDRSRLNKFRDAFRSPQIGRSKSRKDKTDADRLRIPRTKDDSGASPRLRKSKNESVTSSPRVYFDPVPEMSDWIIAQGYEDLEEELEFEIKRIPDYQNYLNELLTEANQTHDDPELISVKEKIHLMISEIGNDFISYYSRMDPSDDTPSQNEARKRKTSSDNLNRTAPPSADVTSKTLDDVKVTRGKGFSARRKSAPSALLFKSVPSSRSKGTGSFWSNVTEGKVDLEAIKGIKLSTADSSRMLAMEGVVQLATGMQSQDRYLFLFNDLLLIAKQKSNTAFKLKSKIPLCDMWIASCLEEVSELTKPMDRSFVIGWPTTNVVATFPKQEVKDDWLQNLSGRITGEKLKDEGKVLQIKVAPKDVDAGSAKVCEVSINNVTQAKDVVLACLPQLDISENLAKDYQLWVLSGKDGTPYPLIGHETPFSIKVSQVRELTKSRSQYDIDNLTTKGSPEESTSSGQKCEFFLKQKKTPKQHHLENSAFQKSMKKNKRSQNFINSIFKRIRPTQPQVFGQPLAEICNENENYDPPESIISLMVLVYQRGPCISGILRRGNNASLGREIREKIDNGVKINIEDHQAPTAASVFKEFIRCIPEGLLLNELHDEWIKIKKEDIDVDKIRQIKMILDKLPPAHYRLLKLTICLLQHLAKHSQQTQMGPSNLATCIAPSFCSSEVRDTHHGKNTNASLQKSVFEITNIFTPLISFMITKHTDIFGQDVLTMFEKYGCQASPELSLTEEKHDSQNHQLPVNFEFEEEEKNNNEEITLKNHSKDIQHYKEKLQHFQRDSNSGTDSDSMHSYLGGPDTGIGMRHDDSSIDSLVDKDYFPSEMESSPKAAKSHLSPSNLSRDSGLTMSDTQLYDEETYHTDVSGKSFQQRTEQEEHNPFFFPKKYAKVPRQESDHFTSQLSNSKLNASTTLLESHSFDAQPSALAYHHLSKHKSSESLEGFEQRSPQDFQNLQIKSDMGTIMKSESGTHLFVSEDNPPRNDLPASFGGKPQHRFLRQSPVSENTPPVSPRSQYSQSSLGSFFSGSYQSLSGESSIYSVPHTPDEAQSQTFTWRSDTETSNKLFTGRSQINDVTHAYQDATSYSKLSPHDATKDRAIHSFSSLHAYSSVPESNKYKSSRKAHETEEFPFSHKLSLALPPDDLSFDQTSISLPPHSNKMNTSHKKSLPFDHTKGSPPPNVVLQSFQVPHQKRLSPFNQRLNADYLHEQPVNSSKNVVSALQDEPQAVKPKQPPTVNSMIHPESVLTSNTAHHYKSKSSGKNFPSYAHAQHSNATPKIERPQRPPSYQRAIQRNFMLKHNVPVDITTDDTERQKEISARAKALYEKSLEIYDAQRQAKSHDFKQVESSMTAEDKTSRLHDAQLGKNSQFTSDNCQMSQNSSYFRDDLSKHPNKLVSLSRNDSKLSDITSSSESSVSTLGKHSDSFGGCSDISSVSSATMSSTSSDKISVINQTALDSNVGHVLTENYEDHMNQKNIQSVEQDKDIRNVNSNADTNVASKKTPRQMYLESIQQFEDKGTKLSSKLSFSSSNVHSEIFQSNTFPSVNPLINGPLSESRSRAKPPNVALHRSQSDSAEHTNQMEGNNFEKQRPSVKYLKREETNKRFEKRKDKTHQLEHSPRIKQPTDTDAKTSQSTIKSERRLNFLKAKSYFHQSTDTLSSTAVSPISIQHSSSLSSIPSLYTKENQQSLLKSATVPVNTSADLAITQRTLPSKFSISQFQTTKKTTQTTRENRQDLPWSVKDLTSKWDKNGANASEKIISKNNLNSPPYHFRKFQEFSPVITPKKSPQHEASAKSPAMSGVFRQSGPQTNLSSRSSNDKSSSPLDKRSTESPDEIISDNAKITYI
ncbi:unnamed protein product [Lymnaea stagnalis]|uniref:Uncharacterized protein n=1 Tax=Lymnaea stagnalis TaxID=6523 RepID=A0AAV2ILU0_LYMST